MMCSIPYHDCTTQYRNKDLMASLPLIGDQVRPWPRRDVSQSLYVHSVMPTLGHFDFQDYTAETRVT